MKASFHKQGKSVQDPGFREFMIFFVFLCVAADIILFFPIIKEIVKASRRVPEDFGIKVLSYEAENNSGERVSLISQAIEGKDRVVIVTQQLPEMSAGREYQLYFESLYQEYAVSIDGELLSEYRHEKNTFYDFGKGRSYNFVNLTADAAGKQVVIYTEGLYAYPSGVSSDILFGEQRVLLNYVRDSNVVRFAFACGAFFISFITILVTMVIYMKRKASRNILTFMSVVLFVSLFLLVDTATVHFWLKNDALASSISVYARLFIPVSIFFALGASSHEGKLHLVESRVFIALLCYTVLIIFLNAFDSGCYQYHCLHLLRVVHRN